MKIRKIKIENFRGVRELEWSLPNADVFCLIGKGDSSKSTILEAIRCAFYPQWNLILSDADFYQCNVAESIVIEVTIGALTEAFCSLEKYGQYLRGWDSAALKLTDEPEDNLESVLTVRLTVGKDLEPKWLVICNRHPEGVPLGPGRDPDLAYRKDVDLHIGAALSKLGVPPLDPRSDEDMAQALALIASIPKLIK